MTNKTHLGTIVMVPVLALMISGCKNPAEGKAKAETGQAQPAPEGALKGATEKAILTPQNTKILWKGSKVTGSHTGGFAKFTGALESSDADPTHARITLDIDMGSVTSDTDRLTGHLKSEGFFWVAKHPMGSFVSTAITQGGTKGASHTITGNLTLRGVTKSITFPATIKITDREVHASSEFWINRQQWGIAFKGMKDNLIRDEVVLTLTVNVPRTPK